MAISDSDRAVLKQAQAIIERELENDGDRVILRQFGTFKRKNVPARKARNPKTGDMIDVPAKSVIKFSASKPAKKG